MSYEKDVQRAKNKCLRLLTYRSRTEYELRCRLQQRGFKPAVINETINRLIKVGLINDELFARDWVKWRLCTKPVGREFLRFELQQKGVDNAIIENALHDYGAGDEFENALALARKRVERYTGLTRRKLAGYLNRRGFSPGVVFTVCNMLAGNDGPDIS